MIYLNMDGELPCVLPLSVHLNFGHLSYIQGYWGFYLSHLLLSEPSNPDPLKLAGWGDGCGGIKILVTAQMLKAAFPFFLNLTFRDFGLGFWLGTWPRACQFKQSQASK